MHRQTKNPITMPAIFWGDTVSLAVEGFPSSDVNVVTMAGFVDVIIDGRSDGCIVGLADGATVTVVIVGRLEGLGNCEGTRVEVIWVGTG